MNDNRPEAGRKRKKEARMLTTRGLAALGWMAFSVLPFASGCGRPEPAAAVEVTVQAVKVTRNSISQHVTGDAVLSPLAAAAISPRITAPVRKFYVERGSTVKKGQLLAILEDQDLSAAVLDDQGAYDQAQAAYNTATKASIPQDYQRAQLEQEQAKANLSVAQQVYDSRLQLFKQGAIPGRDVDTSRASLVQAKAAYDIAHSQLESFTRISHADAIKSAEGQLLSAQGKREGALAQLDYAQIRSPIPGVVTERPFYAGETAPAGTPILTVMDVSSLLAKTHLPQSAAQQLKVGQAAQVHIGGLEKPVAGTVTVISPALDAGSTTVEVWVRIPNRNGSLRAGTPVSVSITSKTVGDALVIPQEAVLTGPSGSSKVMVVGPGEVARARFVETGIVDGGEVQVLSGLKPGERVITNGAYSLEDGTKVKIASSGDQDTDSKPDGDK